MKITTVSTTYDDQNGLSFTDAVTYELENAMEDTETYNQKKLMEMPKDFRDGTIKFLQNSFTDECKQQLCEEIDKDPVNWWSGAHFYWGMGVRNALRDAGFLDDKLPDQNWDDYYIPCIEVAVGKRKIG